MAVHAYAVAESSLKLALFFTFIFDFVQLYCSNMLPMRQIQASTLENKWEVWIKSIRFLGWSLLLAPSDNPAPTAEGRVSAGSQDGFSLTTGCRNMTWTKWDSCWPDNVESEDVVPTSLQRLVLNSNWVVVLVGLSVSQDNRGRKRREGLCVFNIRLVLQRVKLDGQCFSDVKLLPRRFQILYCCCCICTLIYV